MSEGNIISNLQFAIGNEWLVVGIQCSVVGIQWSVVGGRGRHGAPWIISFASCEASPDADH